MLINNVGQLQQILLKVAQTKRADMFMQPGGGMQRMDQPEMGPYAAQEFRARNSGVPSKPKATANGYTGPLSSPAPGSKLTYQKSVTRPPAQPQQSFWDFMNQAGHDFLYGKTLKPVLPKARQLGSNLAYTFTGGLVGTSAPSIPAGYIAQGPTPEGEVSMNGITPVESVGSDPGPWISATVPGGTGVVANAGRAGRVAPVVANAGRAGRAAPVVANVVRGAGQAAPVVANAGRAIPQATNAAANAGAVTQAGARTLEELTLGSNAPTTLRGLTQRVMGEEWGGISRGLGRQQLRDAASQGVVYSVGRNGANPPLWRNPLTWRFTEDPVARDAALRSSAALSAKVYPGAPVPPETWTTTNFQKLVNNYVGDMYNYMYPPVSRQGAAITGLGAAGATGAALLPWWWHSGKTEAAPAPSAASAQTPAAPAPEPSDPWQAIDFEPTGNNDLW